MTRNRTSISTVLIAFVILFSGSDLRGQTVAEQSNDADLSSGSEQVAKAMGLLPLVAQLKELLRRSSPADPWRALYIRQQLLEGVLSASLQVDASTARIESEIAQSDEFRSFLADQRDRKENRLALAGIGTGGAFGVVSSALQISAKHAKAGNSVGIGAGVIITVLSVMSLRAQNGKAQQFPFRSNMLAKIFDRPADSTDAYSPAVLNFLDAVPAIDPDKLTRRQRLIQTWIDVGRLDNLNSPAAQTKIAHLTGTYAHEYKLTINELDDRRAMLQDLRAKLSLMKRDLASFLMSLPPIPPLPVMAPAPL